MGRIGGTGPENTCAACMIVPSPPSVTIRSGSDRSAGVDLLFWPCICCCVVLLSTFVALTSLFNCAPVPKPGTGFD